MSRRAVEINAFLQQQLRLRQLEEVAAVEAARWLNAAGLLVDNEARPGLPLRNMLRAGEIAGGRQRPSGSHGRWFIGRADGQPGRRARTVPVNVPPRPVESGQRTGDSDTATRARRRRERAARKYRPISVKLLLVAEAPPAAVDRYFYFEDVPTQDSLFRYVARAIIKVEPTRTNKAELLRVLRDRGVFLIDLKQDPVDARSDPADVAGLVRRIRRLAPERIIVIKTAVFDQVRGPLLDAGVPLVDERVPFPGSGQQRKFELAFARALSRRPTTR